MSKIAVASNSQGLTEHFGHCDHFEIYVIENNAVTSKFDVKNPEEHQHGYLPKFLYDQGVEVVIAEKIGSMATQIFEALDMKYVLGVSGSAEALVQQYLLGTLQSNPEHQKEGGHGHHHDHKHDHDDHHSGDHHGSGNCHHCH